MLGRAVAEWALVVVLCAGCAHAATGSQPPSSPSPAADASAALRSLSYPPPELALAEHRLTRRCMAERGLLYPASEPRPVPPAATLLRVPPPLTVDRARSEGYGGAIARVASTKAPAGPAGLEPGSGSPLAADEPLRRYLAGLAVDVRANFERALIDPAARRATLTLAGARLTASSGGCLAAARIRVHGSIERFLGVTYLPQLAQLEVGKVESDRELLGVMIRYGRCMTENGYRVRTSAEAAEVAAGYYAGAQRAMARRREIALAIIDARCQEHVALFDTYVAAVNRAADRWIARHRADLLLVAAHARTATRNAREILRDKR